MYSSGAGGELLITEVATEYSWSSGRYHGLNGHFYLSDNLAVCCLLVEYSIVLSVAFAFTIDSLRPNSRSLHQLYLIQLALTGSGLIAVEGINCAGLAER